MKVLILQNKLLHYRVPVFNLLNEQKGVDVTVAYPTILSEDASINFTQVKLNVRNQKGFIIHNGLYKFCCDFDVVIAMFDIKWLTHMKLGFMKLRPFKLIYWGIGVSTGKGFDFDKKFDRLRFFFASQVDALLFYSEYPIQKYIKSGFSKSRLFVAHNTVAGADTLESNVEGDLILFIGSIEKRKKIIELIDAFLEAYNFFNKKIKLMIIGEGSEKENLENYVNSSLLKEKIEFKGAIIESNILEKYYKRAIVSVSPGQAGLSVLTSFSYGIPFLCRKDAITGGERINIQDGHNGYQYEGGKQELSRLLTSLVNDSFLCQSMRENALRFYWENRTLENMIEGFIKAINSVCSGNV